MAFTKDRIDRHSRPLLTQNNATAKQGGPYKPSMNLAAEWPEVFEKRMLPTEPKGRFDRGPLEAEHIVFKDPRPDLAAEDGEEHLNWCILLAETWQSNRELAISLHGFRCQGTRIRKTDSGAFILRPEVSERGWQSAEEYQAARDKYLAPHQKQLVRLLKSLH